MTKVASDIPCQVREGGQRGALHIICVLCYSWHLEGLAPRDTPLFFFFFGLCRAAPVAYGRPPRLRVESELQPPTYTTATATQDPSRVCDPPHSSRQRRILNPLSQAREQTRILMDTTRVLNLLSPNGNSRHISSLDGRAFSLSSNDLRPYKMPKSIPWGNGAQSSGRNRKTNPQEDNTGVMKVLFNKLNQQCIGSKHLLNACHMPGTQ